MEILDSRCSSSSHSQFQLTPLIKVSSPPHKILDKRTPCPLSFSHQWPMLVVKFLIGGEEQNLFKEFRIGNEQILVLHLQFADDNLLFLEGGSNQLRNLTSFIHCFELVSRMRINWRKVALLAYISHYKIFLRPSKDYIAPFGLFQQNTLGFLRAILEGIFQSVLLKDVRRNQPLGNKIFIFWWTYNPY